ncbi:MULTISPECIES: hypothetical protein [Streptomyces]|uniref:hypothetical protein n=1 Tax=Streptomyces TaxID=1883 RepID=UPI0013A875FC|nr:hypothetical protein [Streptomyces sennicomposti]MBY8869425.1 hypothetical protein [Streptomyces sennicomposti]MYS41895.1 hypothetical protein [Streptomyces sp. SID5998]MYX43176.1 hypothetical protein [Streptomyces sp. SID89]NED75073.1 hypothetical protein [Streptomyces sp. SID9944]
MKARSALLALGEVVLWWAALVVLWLMLISTVYTLEWAVGAGAAGVGAIVARIGRRAVVRR